MDFIVKLPPSDSYDTILTVTDTFSKASIFIPCNETINAKSTARLYTTYVLPHYVLPTCIISDRDPHFTSTFSQELCCTLAITQNISTAYVTFSPCPNPIISSITIGLPHFFISIPHPPADYIYDLEASSSTIRGLASLYFSIGDPRTIIVVRLHRYPVRYNLSTDTY